MTVREQWDGGEWQEHCYRLLGLKYGVDVQRVPDRVRGDGGMEAYRLDDGVVYQCYAPAEAFSVAAQTAGQKKKIRDDVRKLVSKPDETCSILGQDYRIRRWVLLTPAYDDKELIKYARTKSKETRDGDPRPRWCHDDFQVVVATDVEMFAVELSQLGGMSSGTIRLGAEEPDESVVESLGNTPNATLRRKAAVDPAFANNPDMLDGFCTDTLLDYVYGQRQLAILQTRYGLAYEAVTRRSRSTFRKITRRIAAGVGGMLDLEEFTQELSANISRDVPALEPIACEDLARHYIAEWLIDCPLRLGISA